MFWIVSALNKMLLNVVFDFVVNMVFNRRMNSIQHDAELIRRLGGPSKVAEILCIDKQGGAQRVQNWITRGIPSQIKVTYPHLFMPELAQSQNPATTAA